MAGTAEVCRRAFRPSPARNTIAANPRRRCTQCYIHRSARPHSALQVCTPLPLIHRNLPMSPERQRLIRLLFDEYIEMYAIVRKKMVATASKLRRFPGKQLCIRPLYDDSTTNTLRP